MKNLSIVWALLGIFAFVFSCNKDEGVVIECTLDASTSGTDASNGVANGIVTATASNGQGAISYSWNTDPVQTTATATGLIAGTYTVTITDDITSGCTDTSSVTINERPPNCNVMLTTTGTDVTTNGGNDGTATATISDEQGTVTYSWDTDPVQNTATATGLVAGTYMVTVTDDVTPGCNATSSVTIGEPAANCTISVTTAGTDATTNGGNDGTATATISDELGTVTYSWDTDPVQTTATATGLVAGTYTVTVTDDVASECTATSSVTISEPVENCTIGVTTAGTDATTSCEANGTVAATISGEQGTVTYSWDTDPVQTTATATGLSAGTYTVTVTDDISSSCTATSSVTISVSAVADNDISILACKFYNSPTVTVDIGTDVITITTTDEPDHVSMYYPTNHALYEDYTDASNPDFFKNPNEISTQNYVFTIPRFPEEATNKTNTEGDAFGVSVNGVVFFNQAAAPGDDILDELNSFDQYLGHPTNIGVYHYHIEPSWLTETISDDAFMGFLLDGFPVYGPEENGISMTNDDLDDYHGHTSATADFPNGIYHYHITDEFPWINGGQFYGTAGTKTN